MLTVKAWLVVGIIHNVVSTAYRRTVYDVMLVIHAHLRRLERAIDKPCRRRAVSGFLLHTAEVKVDVHYFVARQQTERA